MGKNKKNRNKPVITIVTKMQMPPDHAKLWLEKKGCSEDGIGTMFYCKIAYKDKKDIPMLAPSVFSNTQVKIIRERFGKDQIEPLLAAQANNHDGWFEGRVILRLLNHLSEICP